MKLQEIVEYLIKEGNVYIKHYDYIDIYSWSDNRNGYDISFEIEVTKLIDRPDRITQRLILTTPNSESVICIVNDTEGYKSDPSEILARIKYSGVLDGKC